MEPAEKKNTTNGPDSLCVKRYRTQVYAPPAQSPPKQAIEAAKMCPAPAKAGFMINRLAAKAHTAARRRVNRMRSFKKRNEKKIVKNGASFAKMEASASAKWLTA